MLEFCEASCVFVIINRGQGTATGPAAGAGAGAGLLWTNSLGTRHGCDGSAEGGAFKKNV